MLVDFQYNSHSKKLVCSYVDKTGNIKLKYYDWLDPFKYEVCQPNDPHVDKYKSWDGKSIKKIRANPNRYSIYEFLDALPQEEKDELYEFHEPNIYFVDIETGTDEQGFSEPIEARTDIQSISIVYDDKVIILGIKDLSEREQKVIMKGDGKGIEGVDKYFEKFGKKYEFKYIKYDDEFDMMYAFFNKMVPKMACITGWNFVNYDWTFLVNRARRLTKDIGGKMYHIDPKVSSPTKQLNNVFMTEYELPKHRIILDYMELYKALDTSVKVKESNSLDFVSKALLGVKKIEYDGSLMNLFEEDYLKFCYYNAVDSILVQLIHEKMMYMNIIFAVSSLSKIKTADVYSYSNGALASLAITEGVLRERFREQENIVLFKDATKNNSGAQGIQGGWVKDPNVGMNRYAACYDFASLYPTTQNQFFIAPENYKGIQDQTYKNKCIDDKGDMIDITDEDVVCVNGVVFRKRNSPTLQMLKSVYADRKMNKKKMLKAKNELSEVEEEIRKLELELELS